MATINSLTATTTLASGDEFELQLSGGGFSRKITYGNLLSEISADYTFGGFPNGTQAAPGGYFTSDTDLGIYRVAADTMAAVANNTEIVRMEPGLITIVNSTGLAVPSLCFSGDANTGLGNNGGSPDSWCLIGGGVRSLIGTNTYTSSPVEFRIADGSNTAPGLVFAGEAGTGIYRVGTYALGIVCGQEKIARFTYGGGARSLTFNNGSAATPSGIRLDFDTPVWGWNDLTGDIHVKGSGVNNPTWTTYRGGIFQFQFAVNSECWLEFHLPHDIVPGTDFYIHAHWSHNATTVTGGSVTWAFELSYAKGHNQAAFSAPVTPTITQNSSTTQYQHMIAEVQMSASSPSATQIDTDDLEVDGVILCRCYLSANNMTVSGGGVPNPFLHFVDIHYQSTGIPTKNKAPNFYT